MTRYGFAIKALPKGGKPFGDDEDEKPDEIGEEPGSEVEDIPEPPADELAEPPDDPAGLPTEPADPPTEDTGGAEPPPPAAGDARPWSGDMYDEGDETDPANAFASYTGTAGEEAWLDQAPDGTLTGWVRDETGQVWKYTDPDAWAVDVDDAQMTRTHSRGSEPADAGTAAPTANPGGQEPLFPPQ